MTVGNCSFYDIKLKLDPIEQSVAARVRILFKAQEMTDKLTVLLHQDLKVKSISGALLQEYIHQGNAGYQFAGEADAWELVFKEMLQPGQETELTFDYSGRLPHLIFDEWDVNRLTPEWTELGLYTPWFPWDPHGGLFTYQVDLEINPEYRVTGTGKVAGSDGKWTLSSELPTMDITIAAAPDLQQATGCSGRASMAIHHTAGENQEGIRAILADGEWILDFYQNWFKDDQDRHLDVIIAPRKRGGGYVRPGMVMLSDLQGYQAASGNRLFRFIAHEFAHLWWTGARIDSWEDWLNESFAEYSSMKAFESRYGQAEVGQLVTTMRAKAAGLPPIRGLSRNDESAHGVLYTKGALLLWDLAQLIGPEKMDEVLKRRFSEKVITTNGFLNLLDNVGGTQVAQQFDSWLRA